MVEVNPDSAPTTNPVVVLREEFDDWAVLFNPDTASAIGINPVGVTVWKHLDGQTTVSAVVAVVREGFDDVPDTVENEISAFVADLLERGFLGRSSGSD